MSRGILRTLCAASALALFCSCAPTLRTTLSTATTEKLPVAASGMVALPSGEVFELSPIFAKEGRPPAEVQLVRLFGVYFIGGDGFSHLWRVTPKAPREASYEPVDLGPTSPMAGVQLLPHVSSDCVRLAWSDAQGPHQAFINADGDANASVCPQ